MGSPVFVALFAYFGQNKPGMVQLLAKDFLM